MYFVKRTTGGVYEIHIDPNTIKKQSTYAFWCLQMENLMKSRPKPCGRSFITDNFYTRQTSANVFLELTDRETRMLGTVGMNVVDAVNCPSSKKGIDMLERSERGDLLLVNDLDKYSINGVDPTPAEGAVFVLLKDKKVVVLYTNYITERPR